MRGSVSNAKTVRLEHGTCCGSTRMHEGQCSIAQPQGERFIVSGTNYQESHKFNDKLCDYIIFWKVVEFGESVAVVELKGGHVPTSAAKQLANGAVVAERLATKTVRGFAALLVTKTGIHSIDRKYIARQKVSFFGVEHPIQVVACGSRVVDALPWSNAQTTSTNNRRLARAPGRGRSRKS